MTKRTKRKLETTAKILFVVGLIVSGGGFVYNDFKANSDQPKTKVSFPKVDYQNESTIEALENERKMTTYSIDNHEINELENGALMHSNSCKECLKRLGINDY